MASAVGEQPEIQPKRFLSLASFRRYFLRRTARRHPHSTHNSSPPLSGSAGRRTAYRLAMAPPRFKSNRAMCKHHHRLHPAPPIQPGFTDFPAGNGSNKTTVRVYRQINGNAAGQSRGEGMVQTIRPDQLSADQISQINGHSRNQHVVRSREYGCERIQRSNRASTECSVPVPTSSRSGRQEVHQQRYPAQGYPKAGQESEVMIFKVRCRQ